MFTIWKMISPENWELIEELQDDLALAQRLAELRQDGSTYQAEKKDGGFSTVLEV